MKNILQRCLLITTFILFYSSFSFGFYKCIDKNGNVMFTDTLCPEGYQIEKSIPDVKPSISSPQTKSKISKYGGTFKFDGFTWRLIRTHRLKEIGRQSNPQKPKNDYFLVIEAELKNITSKPRYYGDLILMDGENQYQDSTTVSVYAKHQLGYPSKDSTKFEPQARLKTYFGFDVKAAHNFTLIVEGWGGSDKRFMVTLN